MVINFLKCALSLVKHQVLHKIKHLSPSFFKSSMVRGGISLLVITIAWGIIEDIIFPVVFWALGRWVHPAFYAGIPVSWALCLHWIAVPLMWGAWMKRRGRTTEDSGSNSCQ